jgi:hypothetical protein
MFFVAIDWFNKVSKVFSMCFGQKKKLKISFWAKKIKEHD